MKMTQKTFLLSAAAAAVALCGCMCDKSCGCASSDKGPVARHVVLIGVDGFGHQWIPWEKMPNLRKLRDDGLYAKASCLFPTASAINWGSAFFGTIVELHGYRKWNSKKPDTPAYALTENGIPPCIFHEIRRQDPNAYTVSLFDWDGIGFCHNSNAVSCAKFFTAPEYAQKDGMVFDEGVRQLAKKPKFTLLYQGQVDAAGHRFGWGSPEFTNACANVDANIGRAVEAIKANGMWDDTVVMLVADHGGLGKKHGMDIAECFDIPFLVSGPAVKGMRFRQPVILADAAPTVAKLLGYTVPEGWRGRSALTAACALQGGRSDKKK